MKESLCENELQHLLMKRDTRHRGRELQKIYIPQEFQRESPDGPVGSERPRQRPKFGSIDHDIARDIDGIQKQRNMQTLFMNNNRQFLQKFDSINQMIKKSMV